MTTTETTLLPRRAYPHDLVQGAVIRVPAGPGYRSRPFGLEIAWRDPASKETGAFRIGGRLLAQDGTTTRAHPPYRTIVIGPWYEPVTLLRKAPPPAFTAKLAALTRPRDPELEFLGPDVIHRWGVVSDLTGKPLPAIPPRTGPAVIDTPAGDAVYRYTQAGDWTGKPTPWLAREYSEKTPEEQRLRRDPIEQCMDRVRQERGILRIDRLTYDLSVWHHDPEMELADGQWKSTRRCKRCGEKLKFLGRAPWHAALEDGDTECHGEVWVP